MGFPGGSNSKESACNVGDLGSVFNVRDPGSIPGLGRSPREGNGNPFQYSSLENSIDRGPWQTTVCGVARSQTWPSKSLCYYLLSLSISLHWKISSMRGKTVLFSDVYLTLRTVPNMWALSICQINEQISDSKEYVFWDFYGGPVAKIPCSQCRGPGFDTLSGK